MAYANITESILEKQREGVINVFPAAEGETLFAGSMVFVAAGKATAIPAEGALFAGVCAETSSGAVRVCSAGVFPFSSSGLTAADAGKTAFADLSADGSPGKITVTEPAASGALKLAAGILAEAEDAEHAMVHVTGFAMRERVSAVS